MSTSLSIVGLVLTVTREDFISLINLEACKGSEVKMVE